MHDFLLRVCGMVAVLVFGMSSTLEAAPVTFAFDAEISSVSLGIPFDSGIDFSVGDTISGQFTFQPFEENCAIADGPFQPFGCTKPQLFSFSMEIDGINLSVNSYEIDTLNNTGVFDGAGPVVQDFLEPRGRGLSPAEASRPISIDPASSGFGMMLRGGASSINFASIPGSPDVWNQFNLERSLNIFVLDGNGGVIRIRAVVGQFSIVPEPTSLALAMTFISISTMLARRRSPQAEM